MSIFKISLPGNDVKSSTLTQKVLDSQFPSPKVSTIASPPHAGIIALNWQTSGLVYPHNTTKLLYSFPHGYNYIPSVFGACHFDNGSRVINAIMPFSLGALGVVILDSDRTNINLKYYSVDFSDTTPVPPFKLNVRFYVFAERGHE